jgi:hypothetical protein
VCAGLLALGVLSWSVNPALCAVRRPPNYHHMPETSFTCAGKVVGGYYADPDADCQMFHVCVQVDENDVSLIWILSQNQKKKKNDVEVKGWAQRELFTCWREKGVDVRGRLVWIGSSFWNISVQSCCCCERKCSGGQIRELTGQTQKGEPL